MHLSPPCLTWDDCALNSLCCCCCCCRCETEWWLLREGLECCRCWGGTGGGGILICPCGTWYGWNWLCTRPDDAAPMPLVLPSPLSLLVSIPYRNTSHNNNATTSMHNTMNVDLWDVQKFTMDSQNMQAICRCVHVAHKVYISFNLSTLFFPIFLCTHTGPQRCRLVVTELTNMPDY